MAGAKTLPSDASVEQYLLSVENDERREDTRAVIAMMERITCHPPVMWGNSVIGFDTYHYKYASGREGEWMVSAVAPRKVTLTIYVMAGFDRFSDLMGKLGKYKTGSSCLYLTKLSDADPEVLEELITASVSYMRETYQK
ncbi:hypothetical protein A9Q96_05120 [Rhodobacterales bacterium 52_120_T64]|nr:hypothetical protein A9Q96_05120 [Rhodobacterales bacterium 52_120_T64]